MTDDKSRDIFPRKKCQVRLNGNIVRYLLSNSPTHWQVLLLMQHDGHYHQPRHVQPLFQNDDDDVLISKGLEIIDAKRQSS